MTGEPKNLSVDPFPDPVGHQPEDGHPSRMVTHQKRRSAHIKILILRKLLRMPKNLGEDIFPDPIRHFGAPGGHFGFTHCHSFSPLQKQPSYKKLNKKKYYKIQYIGVMMHICKNLANPPTVVLTKMFSNLKSFTL